jgi:hypothetical protein
MDQTSRVPSPESPAQDASKWIGRVLIAVLLGEGIWGLIVSLTNNLLLPFLARTMGADVQSPLYLGKGDFNVPALFISVLELCFAGIVAVILNSWVLRKSRRGRAKSVRLIPIPSDPTVTVPSLPAVVPVQAAASVPPPPATPAPVTPAPSSGQFWAPPESSRPKAATPPPPAKPAKPKPPKEIIYNSVGEPINPTEEE